MLDLRIPALCLALAACGDSAETVVPKQADHVQASGGHVHTAPRGGLLVVLAEETAHVELIFDKSRGRLDLYLLGPHAHKPLRSAQPKIWVTLEGTGEPLKLALDAEGNALSGEKPGSTSHFSVRDDRLMELIALHGHLGTIEVLGRRFEGIRFDSNH